MSSNTGDDGKKRRINYDGGAALSAGKGGREGGDGFAQIMSAMNQLLDQNRLQMAEMKSMADKIGSMEGEIKGMKQKCDVMEKSLSGFRNQSVSRFDDVENRQKYHEILLKNQQWEYSAPDIEPAESLEEDFLDDIKEETCNMRYGKCDGKVIIQSHSDDPIDYDTSFQPHWEEFADALAEYQYALKCLPEGTTSHFWLSSVGLPEPVLNLLSKALESTHFKSIVLDENNFGRHGIKFALNYFQNNPKLEEFVLNSNPIDHEDDVNQLCEIVKDHPTLNTIYLDECCGEDIDGHETLRSIITAGASKLKCISLRKSRISTGGSTFIGDFLATNPILEKLKLGRNNLNDKDATSIASALKHNTNLQCLDIAGNGNITISGWTALWNAEFDSASLNSAADSNHTCLMINPVSRFNGDSMRGDLFESKAARQKKIYSILSARNRECSNVQYLDDVPVEFLPDMLSSIQLYSEYHLRDKAPPKHSKDVKTLSVVYEILRHWEKAFSVYEALSAMPALPKK